MLPTRRALPQRVGVIIAIVLLAGALAFLALGNIGFAFLLPDEQLVMRGLSTVTVRNGPGLALYTPFVTRASKLAIWDSAEERGVFCALLPKSAAVCAQDSASHRPKLGQS